MPVAESTMGLPLGSKAPDFNLPDPKGRFFSLEDFKDYKGLVVAFICNHCPFVKHVKEEFSRLAREYQQKGIGFVAINPNDADEYPDDRPEKMEEDIRTFGYTFPYLIDETQEVAKAYKAACTPEFYLFDRERKLYYRGRMDESRPGNNIPVTGNDLRNAMERLLQGKEPPEEQFPSMGCNIKWKPGNEPGYLERG